MPPKQRITREMILERSFAMFCQEGMAAVNARSVAKALNCSTQPIFSYFSGMDDLKNALDQKAHDVFEQTVSEEAKDCPALEGSSNAYVRFATEQPRLFAHMFLREDGGMQSFGSELAREPMITAEASEKGLDSEKAKRVCEDVRLYAHGLAAMQATGRTNFTQPQIAQRVHEMHEMLLKK